MVEFERMVAKLKTNLRGISEENIETIDDIIDMISRNWWSLNS